MKRLKSVSMERALARTPTKSNAFTRMLSMLDLNLPSTERVQRPHWLNLPPLSA